LAGVDRAAIIGRGKVLQRDDGGFYEALTNSERVMIPMYCAACVSYIMKMTQQQTYTEHGMAKQLT
jgi:hypothetical protein